ncbi:MAG TPA: DUF6132 family protein [Polyangiaceae bacterium]|nr:DUF6132 family protein [Polyangiaceae bacterium]
MLSPTRWFGARGRDRERASSSAALSLPATLTPRWKMTVKLVVFVALGALAGFAYHKLVGCRTGACPITANPWITTVYGAVMGFLLSGGIR